jgi:hypothetical protein
VPKMFTAAHKAEKMAELQAGCIWCGKRTNLKLPHTRTREKLDNRNGMAEHVHGCRKIPTENVLAAVSAACLVRPTCTLDDGQLGRNIQCIFTIKRKQQIKLHVDGTSQIYRARQDAAIQQYACMYFCIR